MSIQDKFENIYEKSVWGKNWKGQGGSGKGDGTDPDSKMWVNYITEFITERDDIVKVADLGCGDWKFSRFIPWKELGIQYSGYDIVQNVVENNNKEYANENVTFFHQDIITSSSIKGYDLVIIKDVLQHLSDEHVIKILDSVLINNKYVIIKNGYKFGHLTLRKNPDANEWTERNINNKYSYHPICLNKYPLNKYSNDVLKMKTHRYKQIVVFQRK